LAEVDLQPRFGQTLQRLVQLDPYRLLAHFDQLAPVLLAAAIEELYGCACGETQHASHVVGRRLGQGVLAEGERGIDEKAGQAHKESR